MGEENSLVARVLGFGEGGGGDDSSSLVGFKSEVDELEVSVVVFRADVLFVAFSGALLNP
jgi:hypothetical protein